MASRMVSIAILLLAWFGFGGQFSVPELIAGGLVSVIAVAVYLRVTASGELEPQPVLRWAARASWAWPRRIVADAWRVLAATMRREMPAGRLRRIPLDPTSERELAWIVVGTSISPNAYVIGFDESARELLIHELVPAPGAQDVVWRPR